MGEFEKFDDRQDWHPKSPIDPEDWYPEDDGSLVPDDERTIEEDGGEN